MSPVAVLFSSIITLEISNASLAHCPVPNPKTGGKKSLTSLPVGTSIHAHYIELRQWSRLHTLTTSNRPTMRKLTPANIETKVQLLANIAIILVASVLTFVALKKFVLTDSQPPYSSVVSVGDRIMLPDFDFSVAKKHLVFVLQKECRFCSESAAFYQRVVRESVGHSDISLIAVLPQEPEEAKSYLDGLGISISKIRKASPASVGVRGTPAVLLVDSSGLVSQTWVGKLSPARENEVLSLFKTK